MRILHTSDWHLGQKFLSKDRLTEHRMALDWLLDTIVQQRVDVLLVAGDIFDIGSPPNYARELYYEFLARLQRTDCQHIVITGGNHDSPSMLNASRGLLRFLKIQVVGALENGPADAVLTLHDPDGQALLKLAAMPFLRDRDLRSAAAGLSSEDRLEQIRTGIRRIYRQAAELIEESGTDLPVIAMGHLYAAGAKASDKQDNIYLGDVFNIQADEFPDTFDYVALGHIHRPQIVGELPHIRYSGSLIPLSFSETADDKSVVLLEFDGKKPKTELIPVPLFRRLKAVNGRIEEIREKLTRLHERHQEDDLPVWVEVNIETEVPLPGIETDLHEWVENLHLELLKIRLRSPESQTRTEIPEPDLDDLQPIEVFERRCHNGAEPPENLDELMTTFRELENWLQEQEEDA